MAFNYANLGNQALENMLPLFSTMANGGGAGTGGGTANHTSFINQLAAAITTAAAGSGVNINPALSSTSSMGAGALTTSQRERTPEPPPAPKLSSMTPPKMKPNQGTAPMDIENDCDVEPTTSATTSTTKLADKLPLMPHDASLFLNSGFMPAAAAAASYMFFPSATAALDPTSMMAAMQQMQQSYAAAGYAALSAADGSGVDSSTQLNAAGDPFGAAASSNVAGVNASGTPMKEVIKTKSCILFPPNPHAPPPTIRERPPGCRTVFVGGLPENITEEIIREIFESCGEITTLRMSKKNFCHIRYRHEASIDRAIYLSGYRVRISTVNEPANFGRLHVDYAQARDDQYDYECKQRQLQREQRHRERMSNARTRSQSPPPMPHYTDHEASLVAENLRNNDTFVKAIQTISAWLERGDCTKRNANVFYSMIQSTHAHVRRLYVDKQQLEEDLRKARECYRKQMLVMSTQFTQIEKVFSAASHKKVWDHFTKAQRKNIDQWKKLASELRSVQIEDDEMEMSDEDRDYPSSSSAKRARYDSESLKEENDSLRCQLEALRSEMSLVRTDIKYDSDFREKQIKVLQETIRNMQTQLMQTKMREQKDAKAIELLERRLREAGVKQLLLKTKIKETTAKLKDKEVSSLNSETSEVLTEEHDDDDAVADGAKTCKRRSEREKELEKSDDNIQIIDIDVYKSDDDVKIIEDHADVVETHEIVEKARDTKEHKSTAKLLMAVEVEATTINQTKDVETEVKELKDTKAEDEQKLNLLALSEAKIIALTAAYLIVQPFGVSSESIHAYLCNIIKSTSLKLHTSTVEHILKTYANLFKAELTTLSDDGVATTRWSFCGFLEPNSNLEHIKKHN